MLSLVLVGRERTVAADIARVPPLWLREPRLSWTVGRSIVLLPRARTRVHSGLASGSRAHRKSGGADAIGIGQANGLRWNRRLLGLILDPGCCVPHGAQVIGPLR